MRDARHGHRIQAIIRPTIQAISAATVARRTTGRHTARRRHWLPIGQRLMMGFLALILLNGLVGVVAIVRLNTLAATTAELNTHDLPEVITLNHLRTLQFQARDLTRGLVSGDDITSQADMATLGSTLDQIAHQRSTFLAFEPPDGATAGIQDNALVRSLMDGIVQSSALDRQILALLTQGQLTPAQQINQNKLAPLLTRDLAITAQLRTLEQTEVADTAAAVQAESVTATRAVFTLIALSLPLSLVIAVLLTRTLSRPLAALLHATKSLAAGNLDVTPSVAAGDEIGRLADAFDGMRRNLRATIAALAIERKQTQAIIDASADGVVLMDRERTILRFNPGAERLSGWTAEQAIGQRCWDVFGCWGAHGEEREHHEQRCPCRLALTSTSEAAEAEHFAQLRSGARRWLAVSCAPVRPDEDDADASLVVSIHDVTQLKAVEQLKSDFVAMVSHELRAPLTTVAGSVETLSALDPSTEYEAYREVLTMLEQQTRRLRKVIEEVLQVTRFDAGHMHVQLQPLRLAPCLAQVVARVQTEWVGEDREVRIQLAQQDIAVWADPDLLDIVLGNLLSNVYKHTPARSPADIQVGDTTADAQVVIRVIDRGPGIPAEQGPHLFDRFVRGPAEVGARGYGLGLYIARELVHAQGGAIWVEPRTGGTCVGLSLRVSAGDATPAAAENGSDISRGKARKRA